MKQHSYFSGERGSCAGRGVLLVSTLEKSYSVVNLTCVFWCFQSELCHKASVWFVGSRVFVTTKWLKTSN